MALDNVLRQTALRSKYNLMMYESAASPPHTVSTTCLDWKLIRASRGSTRSANADLDTKSGVPFMVIAIILITVGFAFDLSSSSLMNGRRPGIRVVCMVTRTLNFEEEAETIVSPLSAIGSFRSRVSAQMFEAIANARRNMNTLAIVLMGPPSGCDPRLLRYDFESLEAARYTR